MSIAAAIPASRPEVHRHSPSPMWYHLDAEAHTLPSAAVLPEQYYAASNAVATSHGIYALMQAVLENALEYWRKQFVCKTRRAQRLAREAEEWFSSDDTVWVFSFLNVCTALGVDPSYIRRGLRQWRHTLPVVSRRAKGHPVFVNRSSKLAA